MTKAKGFGTFGGVFVPNILTILGVIMYLRMGWVVGNAGLKSTLIILLIANLITLFTAFSISSIATNMRMKGGGGLLSHFTFPRRGGWGKHRDPSLPGPGPGDQPLYCGLC